MALKKRLKQKIDEMEEKGIIAKVDKPTAWISSLVAVVKPNKVRVCIDPRDLNKAIQRPKYQIPTLEEVLPELAEAKIFSVLDAKDGFHQVKLEESSSYLTTFWTPYGRYRYLRMLFGISSAPEEFQRRMHLIVEGLPGVAVIADDILVYGCGSEYIADHDSNLRRLLQRARENNLKLNKKKLRLRLEEVAYMGHLLTNKGLRPDPMKVKAIEDLPQPSDKKAVERLLGFVKYLARFLPNLAEVVAPLRKLTEKDVPFFWESQQQAAFDQVKQLVTSAPVLKFYNVAEEVTLQCDASDKGLGATLLQNEQPVAFASRALSRIEQNYAQIEKECLAMLFAAERFSQYLLGRNMVTIHTDHKPLVPIFSKSIFHAPKRLQRMILKLQKYNLVLKYCPGSQMYIADMLSRAYLKNQQFKEITLYQLFQLQQEEATLADIETINFAEYLRVSEATQQKIKKHTQSDAALQILLATVLAGWPQKREDVSPSIRLYWGFRDEITAQNGILYKGSRVIIPLSLRKQMLGRTHSSHQGADSCIQRAKDVIFWPGMQSDIKEMVSHCDICSNHVCNQQKEPLMTYEIPTRPWKTISQDLFTHRRKDYLITVDHYSSFWEVDLLTGTTSQTVIECTKAHFSRYGIPDIVITDNGPQFRSQEYESFAATWEFTHTTSSPHHSQSNGKAESAVKIAKKLMTKAEHDNHDLQLTILNWRNTPNGGLQTSPVQKLHSRHTRTLLPTAESLLLPAIVDNEAVVEDIRLKRRKAKFYYDRQAKPLPDLEIGQPVKLQPLRKGGTWSKATTVNKVGDRSYLVQTNDGTNYRRNRKFLRTIPEPAYEQQNSTEQDGPSITEVVNDKVTTDCSPPEEEEQTPVEQLTMESPVKRTASGRVVKEPGRFKDYVRH